MTRLLKRLLVTAAVVAVGLALLLPVPGVMVHRRMFASIDATRPARSLLDAEGRVVMADFLPAVDTSLTLAEAGALLRALLPLNQQRAEAYVLSQPDLPIIWNANDVDSTLFADARLNGARGRPLDRRRLFLAVRRGLTPEERAYAANVAGDTLWTVLDRVARAAGADIVAASFIRPFPEDLTAFDLPVPRAQRISGISDGVALRAASLLAAGQRDSAERAIASLYGAGVLLHREGLNLLEGLLGYRLALDAVTLRRSLHDAYPMPDSPAIIALADSLIERSLIRNRARAASAPEGTARDYRTTIAALSAAAASPQQPRSRRYEALGLLSLAPCAAPGTLLLGPTAEVEQAQTTAQATLPRTAAESAYVRLLTDPSATAGVARGDASAAHRAFRRGNGILASLLFAPRIRRCADAVSLRI